MTRILGYWPADFVFAAGVALMFLVLLLLHLQGKINLVECLQSTDRRGIVRTDPRKMIEFCTWYILTLGFVYIVVHDKLTEWYVAAYISGATLTRFLRDREKRMAPQAEPRPGPPKEGT